MLHDQRGTPTRLDFPFTVSPSGAGMAAFFDEAHRDALLVLLGYTPSLEASDRQDAVALVTISGVVQAVYGYPNEEAYWRDPRGDLGHGLYELAGSQWVEQLNEYNRRSFGTDYFWRSGARPRHFFVGSKDVSAQFLAGGITLDVFADTPFKDVRAAAIARLNA